VPAEVQAAAQSGLPEFLRAVPRAALADLGFKEASELGVARLGRPYEVHVLTPEGLQSAAANGAVEPFLQPTEQWIFPVLVGNQPTTLLWVDRMPEGYRAVQLGNPVLAQSLGQWEEQLPQLLRQRGIVAARPRLVQMPQLLTDILLMSSGSGEFIAPLHVAPELSASLPPGALSSIDRALPKLRDALNDLGMPGDDVTLGGGPAAETPVPASGAAALTMLTVISLAFGAWLYQRTRPQNEPAP
jgi:hypothetical protein